jgi:hypothetical protein
MKTKFILNKTFYIEAQMGFFKKSQVIGWCLFRNCKCLVGFYGIEISVLSISEKCLCREETPLNIITIFKMFVLAQTGSLKLL